MSKEFWNERFSSEEFIYGTEPNRFFKEQIDSIDPGYLLLPGEGEGRNAVYAAKLGWKVDAVDFSLSAQKKALQLAKINNVKINYDVCDFNEYNFKDSYYDVVVMIFIHLPVELRKYVFNKSFLSLKQNGRLILEAFSKEQINNSSGGPRAIDLLLSEQDILDLTGQLKTELIESKVINLEEGEYHKGIANVVRFVGAKV